MIVFLKCHYVLLLLLSDLPDYLVLTSSLFSLDKKKYVEYVLDARKSTT